MNGTGTEGAWTLLGFTCDFDVAWYDYTQTLRPNFLFGCHCSVTTALKKCNVMDLPIDLDIDCPCLQFPESPVPEGCDVTVSQTVSRKAGWPVPP